MVLVDCKDAVVSGNGKHLTTIQKQMLFHFASVSAYNSYAIEMLISTLQIKFSYRLPRHISANGLHWLTGKEGKTKISKSVFCKRIETVI